MSSSLPLKLILFNLARWIRHHWVSWGLLAGIYSIAATVLFTAILELRFKQEPPFLEVWLVLIAALGIPALFEKAPLPVIPAFKVWKMNSLMRMYITHELRRFNPWLCCFLPLSLSVALGWTHPISILVLTQINPQRALYSIHRWRTFAVTHCPDRGARELMLGFAIVQTILILPWFILNSSYWTLGLAGTWLGASLIFEGDSGRPGLVNSVVMTGALLGSLLGSLHWLVLIFCLDFMFRMARTVKDRLKSVEYFDEDTLL